MNFIAPLSGWLVLNKPVNMTSAQAVGAAKRRLRAVTGQKVKIGHTGTLDPFATGVLPLAIGEATKLSQLFLDTKKSYDFTLYWGEKTDTADIEGSVIETSETVPNQGLLQEKISSFLGQQEQLPPKYSALKVNGKRAYDLARQNIDFTLHKRKIFIHDLSLLKHDIENKLSYFSVTCSKGTYIRTLGEDIAAACGSVGHLKILHRTKVGFFSLQHAIFPDIDENIMYKAILGVTGPLSGISAISVDNTQEQALRFGQSIYWDCEVPDSEVFPVIQRDHSQIIALASCHDMRIFPKRVFNL